LDHHPQYKQWISFRHLNLVETENARGRSLRSDSLPQRHDLLCAGNEPPPVWRLHGSLGSYGWLVVGASEHNLKNYTGFRAVNAVGAKFYQKVSLPTLERRRLRVPVPKLGAAQTGAGRLGGLRLLADRWRLQGADEYTAEGLLAHDQLNPATHFYGR